MKRNKVSIPDLINSSPDIDYTQIANSILDDKKLSYKAKGILCTLLRNKQGWKSNLSALTQKSKDGVDSVQAGLKELENAGYLVRVRFVNKTTKRMAGSIWAYSHISNDIDYQHIKHMLDAYNLELMGDGASTGFSTQGKAISGKASCGKSKTNNININNTKNNKIKNKKETFFDLFMDNLNGEYRKSKTFQSILKEYIDHRKEKSSLTKTAIKRLAIKLQRFTVEESTEALETSIENGWSGVFPKKKNDTCSRNNKPHGSRINGSSYEYRKSDITI